MYVIKDQSKCSIKTVLLVIIAISIVVRTVLDIIKIKQIYNELPKEDEVSDISDVNSLDDDFFESISL